MGALYIDRRDAALDYRDGQILVRDAAGQTMHYPLLGIERLVVFGNVDVQSRLLIRLSEAGIGALFIGGRGGRFDVELGGPGHGDAARRLGQYRLLDQQPRKVLALARTLVRGRARGALRLLCDATRQRPDKRRQLVTAIDRMQALLSRLKQTRDLDGLRGLEGAIAAAYFDAYTRLFAPELSFTGRNRRPPRDPVNAALSLGYTLAHADARRACRVAGLDPLLGALHALQHGRASLACDLTELGRADIERCVWRLFSERALTADQFESHAGGVALRKSARQVFYAAIEAAAAARRRRLRRVCQALVRLCLHVNAEARR